MQSTLKSAYLLMAFLFSFTGSAQTANSTAISICSQSSDPQVTSDAATDKFLSARPICPPESEAVRTDAWHCSKIPNQGGCSTQSYVCVSSYKCMGGNPETYSPGNAPKPVNQFGHKRRSWTSTAKPPQTGKSENAVLDERVTDTCGSFFQSLENCTPFKCLTNYPLVVVPGTIPMELEVVGLNNSLCGFKQRAKTKIMMDRLVMDCNFDERSRKIAAKQIEMIFKNQIQEHKAAETNEDVFRPNCKNNFPGF